MGANLLREDETWRRYWLPNVFREHLSDETLELLESNELQSEHELFLSDKKRTDRQFWTDLLQQPPPPVLV